MRIAGRDELVGQAHRKAGGLAEGGDVARVRQDAVQDAGVGARIGGRELDAPAGEGLDERGEQGAQGEVLGDGVADAVYGEEPNMEFQLLLILYFVANTIQFQLVLRLHYLLLLQQPLLNRLVNLP